MSDNPAVEDLGCLGNHLDFPYDQLRRVYVTAWIETQAVSWVQHGYWLVPPTWTLGDVRRQCRRWGWQEVSVSWDVLLLARARS